MSFRKSYVEAHADVMNDIRYSFGFTSLLLGWLAVGMLIAPKEGFALFVLLGLPLFIIVGLFCALVILCCLSWWVHLRDS